MEEGQCLLNLIETPYTPPPTTPTSEKQTWAELGQAHAGNKVIIIQTQSS